MSEKEDNTRTRLYWIVATTALVIAACGGVPDNSAQSNDGSTSTTSVEAGSLQVITSEHGEILAGPEGNALYVFTADTGGVSACSGDCAASWPPLSAEVGVDPTLDSSMFGEITRDDGTPQMTVNGMPLYYYSGDTAPGDTAGQGLNDSWFVVDPSGVMVSKDSNQTDDSVIDYDY